MDFPHRDGSEEGRTPRPFVDYRTENLVIKDDKWPLIRIEDIFDYLAGGQRF